MAITRRKLRSRYGKRWSSVEIELSFEELAALLHRLVCPARRGVLTLISVPLNVRSGSVSVRVFSMDFGRPDRFFGVFRVGRAGVAQLVEHLICNQRVGGSNPFASSTIGKPEPEPESGNIGR